ncbi:autotransporter assembly complex protein TamA [Kiritimatiellota bacterium B12222]|nr:autotransporter assembly complex protein TamA [Kiritimatiellota bacterium B12222]
MLACVGLSVALAEQPTPDELELRYTVHWNGIKKHPQKDALVDASRVERLKDAPVPSFPLLQKRVNDDIVRLQSLLQAQGYYEAQIETKIDTRTQPITVNITSIPGPLYRIGSQSINYEGSTPPRSKWKPYLIHTDPATTTAIQNAERRMLRHFKNNGQPYPRIVKQDYLIDLESKVMDLSYTIDPGPTYRFGELEIEGMTSVGKRSILRQVTWDANQFYDLRLIEDFEKHLILSGLFSKVRITEIPPPADATHLDFILEVTERYQRTIRFGVNYQSEEGFGVNSSWEHRNLFGDGEDLTLNVELSELSTIASADFSKPGFKIRNQSLLYGFEIADERPEAYDSTSFSTFIGLGRSYSQRFLTSVAIGYKYSSVTQSDENNNYGLIYLPIYLAWDTTLDELNPQKGYRLNTELTPYTDVLNGDLDFARLQITGTHYYTLSRRPIIVLAGRATAGTLQGAATDDIPADERFYSGGGGSVRGYSYQSIGPKVDGQSVGGSSLLEMSFEVRARFTETWGFATFIDGGMVATNTSPHLNTPMQWGAGAGLRIFTGIGPLRLDLAYPINPDEDQESRLQFYISLGQAF